MSKTVLIRKQMGGVTQQVMVDQSKPQTNARSDLATLRGGAYGLNPDTGRQGFIPAAQLPGAAPTGMQRLGAGANLAGRGLAAALTGLQTAYGLQGGNVGALGSVKDQYRANVGGLTGGSPTEAQQGQNMAMDELARQNAEAAKTAMMRQVNQAPANQSGPTGTPLPGQPPSTRLGNLPAGIPTPQQPAAPVPAPPVPAAPTTAPAAAPAAPTINEIAGPLSGFGLEQQQTIGQTQPVQPLPIPPKPTQDGNIMDYGDSSASTPSPPVPPYTPFTQPVPPDVATMSTHNQSQQDPTHGGRVKEAELKIDGIRFGSKTAFDLALKNRGLKSFVQAIYDEMGDALYKADPHVAGLIISRIYMDKFVR